MSHTQMNQTRESQITKSRVILSKGCGHQGTVMLAFTLLQIVTHQPAGQVLKVAWE